MACVGWVGWVACEACETRVAWVARGAWVLSGVGVALTAGGERVVGEMVSVEGELVEGTELLGSVL